MILTLSYEFKWLGLVSRQNKACLFSSLFGQCFGCKSSRI